MLFRGDYVEVKAPMNPVEWIEIMYYYIGDIGIIKQIDYDENFGILYKLDFADGVKLWFEECELIKHEVAV